jgi:hypothetical protein
MAAGATTRRGLLAAAGGAAALHRPGRLVAATRAPATYHVAANGDDRHDGLSEAQPWATVTRVNAAALQPGDQVLFRGGDSFAGPLLLGPQHGGAAGAPTRIGSYGPRRATIEQPEDASSGAMLARDPSHITIARLILRGRRSTDGTAPGLWALSTPAAGGRLPGVTLEGLLVHGFSGDGILIGDESGLPASGFEGLLIAGCEAFDCALGGATGGITVYGRKGLLLHPPTHAGLRIADCLAHHNPGRSGLTRHTGSGISLGQCEDSAIEHCTAFANGALSESAAEGPVGIWIYDSLRCVIRHCTSHGNRTGPGRPDGGGFDLDGGCVECRIEHCLSHGNDGAGYLLYQYADPELRPLSGNVIRFNISVDDARQPVGTKGALIIGTLDGRRQAGNAIHGNTVFTEGPERVALRLVVPDPSPFADCLIANNIFHVAGSGSAFLEAGPALPSGWRLLGNCYWTPGEARIGWGGTAHGSVAAWRDETGQETLGGTDTALTRDPLLAAPGAREAAGYRLRPGSPAIGAGLDLRRLQGIEAGPQDHFGRRIPHLFRSGFNIGADGSPGAGENLAKPRPR